jgi:hypothetical protein
MNEKTSKKTIKERSMTFESMKFLMKNVCAIEKRRRDLINSVCSKADTNINSRDALHVYSKDNSTARESLLQEVSKNLERAQLKFKQKEIGYKKSFRLYSSMKEKIKFKKVERFSLKFPHKKES